MTITATVKGWLTLSTFSVFCCGSADPEVTEAALQKTENPNVELSPRTAAASDFFGCVVLPDQSPDFPGPLSCTRPLIPSRCSETRDFDRVHTTHISREFVVLSLHGGHIEENTSEVGDMLAHQFNWDRYDFKGHGTVSCLRGATNREILHITATHFNDPDALAVVRSHIQAVAIDGNRNLAGENRGTICVGGLNGAARAEFISSVQANPLATNLPFRLTPIDATMNTAFPCRDAAGVSFSNLVNLGENGGLQLELGPELLAELASNHPGPRVSNLQSVFSSAVDDAIHQQ